MTLSQNNSPSVRTWTPAFDTAKKGVTYDSSLNLTTLRCAQVNVAMVFKNIFGVKLKDEVQLVLIEEAKLDRFNLPHCAAPAEEARHIIKKEGSLNIERFKEFQVDWDACIVAWAMTYVLINRQEVNLVVRSWRFARKVVEHLEVEKGEC